MSLPANLFSTTQKHLEDLVTSQAQEGPHLEFKRELPSQWTGEAKQEFLADVSAFANSGGGELIYGINEDDDGQAAAIVPMMINSDNAIRQLQDFLLNSVEPRLPGIQVVAVPVSVAEIDGCAIAIRVPQSWVAPHRLTSNRHFYFREGPRKRHLDIPEIRGLFLKSENQAQQMRNFRTERLGKILSGEAPHKLVEGPILVAHIIPTQAALGLVQIDPVQYESQRYLPILGSSASNARLNVDGALSIRNPNPAGTHGYTQFFRNGFLESVKVLGIGGGRPKAVLPSLSYEEDLMKLLEKVRAELAHLGIAKELTIMLSLLRADEVELGLDRFNHMLDDHQGHFDRKTLVLPDVLVQDEGSEAMALKPLFDLVWQSAGLTGSLNYTSDGQRKTGR